jgi:AbrB family looped-hinge helix DNA binding protein
MKEIVSTITSKGQITVPAEVRRRLGLTAGDKMAFVMEDDGTVRVRPLAYPTIASLRGAAGRLARPLSWNEMREIAREDYLATEYPADE